MEKAIKVLTAAWDNAAQVFGGGRRACPLRHGRCATSLERACRFLSARFVGLHWLAFAGFVLPVAGGSGGWSLVCSLR